MHSHTSLTKKVTVVRVRIGPFVKYGQRWKTLLLRMLWLGYGEFETRCVKLMLKVALTGV